MQKPTRNEEPKNLYNPLLEDFTVWMATDEGRNQYILHAQEVETFPTYIANHILKHLAMKIYNEKYGGKITRESIMPDILKEIEV